VNINLAKAKEIRLECSVVSRKLLADIARENGGNVEEAATDAPRYQQLGGADCWANALGHGRLN
jgi:hypothetical protein